MNPDFVKPVLDSLTQEQTAQKDKIRHLLTSEDTVEMGLEILRSLDSITIVEHLFTEGHLENYLFDNLVAFDASDYYLYRLLMEYPQARPLDQYPFQPDHLQFKNMNFNSLPQLPKNIKKLTLSAIQSLEDLKSLLLLSNLQTLTLNELMIKKLPQLPNTLKTLTLKNLGQCTDFTILKSLTKLKKMTLSFLTFKALPVLPESLTELTLNNLYSCNDFSTAFSIEHILVKGSESVPYLHAKADWLGKTGRREEAVEYYQKILELEPDDVAAWNNMGNDLHFLGRQEEALGAFLKTIEINPNHTHAYRFYHNIGRIYYRIGDLKNTIEYWKKSLTMKPDFFGASVDLAEALIADRKPEEAVIILKDYLSNYPDPIHDGICYFLQAIALKLLPKKKAEQNEAESHFKKNAGLNKGKYGFTADNIYRYFENDPEMTHFIRELSVYL